MSQTSWQRLSIIIVKFKTKNTNKQLKIQSKVTPHGIRLSTINRHQGLTEFQTKDPEIQNALSSKFVLILVTNVNNKYGFIKNKHLWTETLFWHVATTATNTAVMLLLVLLLWLHHTQPFYGPFSGTTQVSRCQKRTSGLYVARAD